jgi:hypothetical protein
MYRAMYRLTGNRRPDAFQAFACQAFACLCLALLGLVATMGSTAAQSPPAVKAGDLGFGNLGSCSVFLPPKTTTIVYDTYGGGLPSKYRLLDEPTSYLGRTEITVPKKDSPLFLVLVSYSATEWDMNIQPGAQIAEILVLGYHHQIVSHVPPNTEVGFSIYVGGAGRGCPNGVYWTDHDLPSKLRPMLSGRFSRRIDEYYRSSSEECVKAGCLGFSKAVKEPGGSFWSRLFGSKAPAVPETAGSVRASAQICGENCGKRKSGQI